MVIEAKANVKGSEIAEMSENFQLINFSLHFGP